MAKAQGLAPPLHRSVSPLVIFFPPNPPPLGTTIRDGGGGRIASSAPDVLSSYVGELFYPPLSSRVYRGRLMDPRAAPGLNGKQREWLTEFDSLRFQLVSELKTTLVLSQADDQETRQSKLESLARKQNQSLNQLERIAEELRDELSRSGNWYSKRDWKLGKGKLDRPREEIALFEFEVIRASAFYQEEMSPQQRRLVRELAIEREQTVLSDSGTQSLDDRLVFFQPETSRFILPDFLSEDLRAKLDEFRAARDLLKKELADALFKLDGVWFPIERERGLQELSARQQARLDDLEVEAEVIRQEFALLDGFIGSWAPGSPLPQELQTKIDRFLLPTLDWDRGSEPDPRLDRTVLESEILAELEASPDPNLTPKAGELLHDFLVRRKRQTAYYFYANAIFQPGMSPAQRRLLFKDAVTNLHLVLPGADFQATYVPKTIIQ